VSGRARHDALAAGLQHVGGLARVEVLAAGSLRVRVMDSVALASADDAGHAIVTGSHGGASAGEYAQRAGVACYACNDAGFGKHDAGVRGLRDLDAAGIAGVAVAHTSARVGDGGDAWAHGIVSFVNETARAGGIVVGGRLADALRAWAERVSGAPAVGIADPAAGPEHPAAREASS